MEELLNKLIEKGWKPFGHKYVSVEYLEGLVRFYYEDKKSCIETLRTMTAKESGLWQFVCENGMIKAIGSEIEIKNLNEGYGVVRDTDYQYRLIESSLKDESELEDFLLNSIKLD